MPVYEFICQACHKRASFLTRSVSSPLQPRCAGCGSEAMVRTVSRFAYHKSMSDVWEESGEPTSHAGPDYYKDPRNIGRWAEKKFKDMGVEMPGQLQQEIQAAREGELPSQLKELKSAVPDSTYH